MRIKSRKLKRIAGKNLGITILSKGIGFFSAIYIARQLGKDDFAFYNILLLWLTYLPLLQAGAMNGFNILYPKKIHSEDSKVHSIFFNHYFWYSLLLQVLFSFSFLLLPLGFGLKASTSIILALGGVFILSKLTETLNTYFASNLLMNKMLWLKAITDLLMPTGVLVLFYLFQTVEAIFAAQALVLGAAFLAMVWLNKIELLPPDRIIKNWRQNLKEIYTIGFPVYLSMVADIAFRSADRIFIGNFYRKEIMANYSFATNMAANLLLVSVSIIVPYSQVLFREVAQGNWTETESTIRNTQNSLMKLLGVVILLALPGYWGVNAFYLNHKYDGTILLFAICLIGFFFISLCGMLIYYLNASKQTAQLLKFQLAPFSSMLLAFAIASNNNWPVWVFALSMAIACFIYWLSLSTFVVKDLKKRQGLE